MKLDKGIERIAEGEKELEEDLGVLKKLCRSFHEE